MDREDQTASFKPTKRFFVEMLTRDIALEDAILDLLDNCLDGVARSQRKNPDDIDYHGYWVKIEFNKNSFEITDNCGGIPSSSIDYAFRMGRPVDAPRDNLATVGVYGIGMKRSIFKLGRNCNISTAAADDDSFQISINEDWLTSDDDWDVPIQHEMPVSDVLGTKIKITDVYENVGVSLGSKKFINDLKNKIVYAYSYIISKGFKVEVNGDVINPNPLNLRYEEVEIGNNKLIEPFIYKATIDDVEISLIVGFYEPLPAAGAVQEGMEGPKYSSGNAGWTIVCNDRIVVYKDKTELTGWGIDYARYHTQFTAISGIVYFKSNYPEKLPITTTKRGIDAGSKLFLKAKKHMVEGTKLFIKYTNQWKGESLLEESNQRIKKSLNDTPLNIISKFDVDENKKWVSVRNTQSEKKFVPSLPVPKDDPKKSLRMLFYKSAVDVDVVKDFLRLEDSSTASQVGESCFNYVLIEAEK